ncbi:hypothetical protein CMV_027688 [Castanea mollissima]|uniref:Uncharacterized protein n=1 Tax=Castanea mollissima TaxID=60419 RepID=A0A8J4QBB9_9ROSI|nr:hypothetical protein CMV_027688 [Castanea mollissima]
MITPPQPSQDDHTSTNPSLKRKESRQELVLHSKRIKIVDAAPEADALDPESVKFNPKADVELLVLEERQVASGIETTDCQAKEAGLIKPPTTP